MMEHDGPARALAGDDATTTGRSRPHPRCWLGTVALGSWGNTDRLECVRLIHAALDAGITAIDTADSYADGESEAIVGEALRGRRDETFVSTKFGFSPRTSTATESGGGAIRRALEGSLRRLDTDHVDVYFLHRVDDTIDLDDTIATLSDLVAEGKVSAVGTSMAAPSMLERLRDVTERCSRHPFTFEQPPYSIFVREIEREVLPTCRRLGVFVTGFAPLNGGWLTGQYRRGVPPPPGSRADKWPIRRNRYDFERPEIVRKLQAIDELGEIARDSGRTLAQLALAFALSHADVGATIVGPKTIAQLDALVTPFPAPLSAEVLARIDAVVSPGSTVDGADLAGYGTGR
jgi:aryl-alcohol dehydrogenase (NADP+)